jgi:hypothetical protein
VLKPRIIEIAENRVGSRFLHGEIMVRAKPVAMRLVVAAGTDLRTHELGLGAARAGGNEQSREEWQRWHKPAQVDQRSQG